MLVRNNKMKQLIGLLLWLCALAPASATDFSCTYNSMPLGSMCAQIGSLSVTPYGDVNQAISTNDRNVVTSTALTTTRTWTLINANAYIAGARFSIYDRANGVTASNTLTIAVQAGDSIVVGGTTSTSLVLNTVGGCLVLESDGISKWMLINSCGVGAPLARSAGSGNLNLTGAAGQILAGATPAFTATPTLGASGTLGSLTFGNATSGLVTVQPVAGALGTVTQSLPAASGTFAVSASAPIVLNATTGALTLASALGAPSATTLIVGSSTTLPAGDTFVVTSNATTLPVSGSGVIAHFGAANATSPTILTDSFAANGSFTFRRANNTAASPSALAADDIILNMAGLGYGATAYATAAKVAVRFLSGQTWTDANQGTYATIHTTPNGSTTLAEAMRVNGSKGVGIGTTTDPGASNLAVAGTTAATSKTTGSGTFGGGIGVAGATYTDTLNIITVANASTTAALCWNSGTGLVTENGAVGTCTVSTLAAKNLTAPLSPREGFDIVMAMEPWRYTLKEGLPTYKPGEQIGFVAEYALQKEPRLVAVSGEHVDGFLYEQYTAALTGAVKHLAARVDQLEADALLVSTLPRHVVPITQNNQPLDAGNAR